MAKVLIFFKLEHWFNIYNTFLQSRLKQGHRFILGQTQFSKIWFISAYFAPNPTLWPCDAFSLCCRFGSDWWVSWLSLEVRGPLVIGHRITGTSFKVIGCTVHKFINSPVVTGTLRSPVGSGVELTSDLAGPLPHHYIIRRFPSELLSCSTFLQDSREL